MAGNGNADPDAAGSSERSGREASETADCESSSPEAGRRTRVGVDVGGTFTDVVVVRDGDLSVYKTPSTPDAPERGVLAGLEAATGDDGPSMGAIDFLGHGTTVTTNAVLEGEWAETALVTTAGFRDVLEIGRQARPSIYDLRAEKPDPVVPRDRRFEVPERLDERGRVLEPLDESAAREIGRELAESDAESLAVALLFSFENDNHERRVATILRDAGVECPISLSSVVLPEIREYERTLATALNAALRPVMDRYLGRLERELDERGVPADLRVVQSNGGLTAAGNARERPVETLLSGPAAGVRGAAHVAGLAGHDDVLTMDMGGTSCDVSLVTGGEPTVATDVSVGPYPIAVPMVDVHTVGSGGGSVAWLDEGGALRVGPRSAGADPGPICYGRGGSDPTTTDAQYLLGRIDPSAFLGDAFSAGAASADDAFSVEDAAVRSGFEPLADGLGTDVEGAARGVVDVANATMERALRVVSVERGRDPRDFALVAYGGAGPVHACALADALGVPRVLVPRTAGVCSALGLLAGDVVYDFGTSRIRPLSGTDPRALEESFADLEAEGRDRLRAEGFDDDRTRLERSVDLRYRGQTYDLSVPAPDSIDETGVERLSDRFHERHRERYGHAAPDEPLELVAIRLRARGLIEPPSLEAPAPEGTIDDALRERRSVDFDGDARETPVYDRSRLPADEPVDGPAIVEGVESTLVVHPDQTLAVDEHGTAVVEVNP